MCFSPSEIVFCSLATQDIVYWTGPYVYCESSNMRTIYIYIYIYIYMCVCVCVCVSLCVCVCMYVCMYTFICISFCVLVCIIPTDMICGEIHSTRFPFFLKICLFQSHIPTLLDLPVDVFS